MNRHLILASIALGGALPASRAQTANTAAIPAHGTATSTAGTQSTAITSETILKQYGLATPEEAQPLLLQYHAQEEQLFAQRQAAYAQMKDKSNDEKLRIWHAMVEAQHDLIAEHRTLEKRLSAALKDEREKAAAAMVGATKSVDQLKP